MINTFPMTLEICFTKVKLCTLRKTCKTETLKLDVSYNSFQEHKPLRSSRIDSISTFRFDS